MTRRDLADFVVLVIAILVLFLATSLVLILYP